MTKLQCSAVISDDQDRKAIMAWVRASKAQAYGEKDQTVSLTYELDENDPEASSTWWGIIHVFEQYAEHSIIGT